MAGQRALGHQSIIDTPADNLAIEEIVSGLVTRLVQVYAEEKPLLPRALHSSLQIKHAIDKLEDEFRQNHCLESLAGLAGISKYHFIRVFRNHTRLTPHKYLNQVRIQSSEQMLRKGLDLSEIAFCTGFSNQSHFTRTFKSIKGVSPGYFRNFVQDVHN